MFVSFENRDCFITELFPATYTSIFSAYKSDPATSESLICSGSINPQLEVSTLELLSCLSKIGNKTIMIITPVIILL